MEKNVSGQHTKPSEPSFVGFVVAAPPLPSVQNDTAYPEGAREKTHLESKGSEEKVNDSKAALSGGASLTSEGETSPTHDRYAQRVQETLKQMILPDYPARMIPWLEANHKWIYRTLVDYLPETIHRQWEQRLPLHEFEVTLAELLDAQQVALTLYRREVIPNHE